MAQRNLNRKSVSLIDMSTESRPTIFISAEDDSFGVITNVNLAVSVILGYKKTEMLNRNVKVCMPLIYSR